MAKKESQKNEESKSPKKIKVKISVPGTYIEYEGSKFRLGDVFEVSEKLFKQIRSRVQVVE